MYTIDAHPTLISALEYLTVEELKGLQSLFGPVKQPVRKSDLVATIAQRLQGDELQRLFSLLDDLQKAAVSEVVHSPDSSHDANRFQAKYGRQPSWIVEQEAERRYGAPKFTLLSLFFIRYVMPADLKARLCTFVPKPAKAELKTLDGTPTHVQLSWTARDPNTRKDEVHRLDVPLTMHDTERHALEDVVSILRLVDAGKVAVSERTRLATKTAVTEIAHLLSGGDYYSTPQTINKRKYDDLETGPIKAVAWPLIVQAGGLAELCGKRLKLTAAGENALKARPADVLRSLWDGWLNSTILDELRRIEVIKGQTGRGLDGLTDPSMRRETIADVLAGCPPSRWVPVSDFWTYMRATGRDVLVTTDPWSLYIADANYGSLGHSSSLLNGRYLLCFLFEYAATLGLIDVGYFPPELAPVDYGSVWGTENLDFFSRYDGLSVFRLNALGAYCLGLTPTYVQQGPENRPLLRVLPNLDIVLVGERLPPGDHLMLEIYAERVSESVWRLDQSKLLAVLESGRNIANLREFLQTRASHGLPETTMDFLADLERRGGMLSDAGPARLIECRDKMVAALIANDPRTRRLCQLAGERHLVVSDGLVTAFRRAVRNAGYVLPT